MFLLSTVQTILCIVLITLVLFVIISGVTIVPKDKVYIVERLGVYHNTWKKGIYFRLIGVEKFVIKFQLLFKITQKHLLMIVIH